MDFISRKKYFFHYPPFGGYEDIFTCFSDTRGLAPLYERTWPPQLILKKTENEPNHHVTMAAYLLRHISIPK